MNKFVILGVCFLAWMPSLPAASVVGPGSQAVLSPDFHNVSGTVTILSESSLRIDDFTFDGGGIDVYFYLGSNDSTASFLSGLEIGPQLFGTTFDGLQAPLVIELPAGEVVSDYGAISVWCTAAGVSFGSGSFSLVPEPGVSFLMPAGLAVLLRRRRSRFVF